jgi:hypothetical protein
MAVVCIEGWDHAFTALKPGRSFTANISQGSSTRFGVGRSLRADASGSNPAWSITLPSTYSTLIVGFAFQANALLNNTVFNLLDNTGAVIVRLATVDSLNHLAAYNAAATQLGSTGTNSLLANTWNYIEIKVVVNATTGSVEVRLNGATSAEISATNVNTGSVNIARIGAALNNAGTTCNFDYDDIYAADTTGSAPNNTFLGDVRVEQIALNAEGANTGWTANTGTKVSRVNEGATTYTYDGDTGYIESATPGAQETFAGAALAVTSGTVHAVQLNIVARKDDAGLREIARVIRTGATDHTGATLPALGTSYTMSTELLNQDPDAADWTVASVNAAEWGVEVIT